MTKISDELKTALDYLTEKFMTIDEYLSKIAKDELVEKPPLVDDAQFYRKYPHHPLASENRFKRIKGADIINNYDESFPEPVLEKIHEYIFDCCAAVRLSLIKTITKSGNKNSLQVAQNLLNKEKEIKSQVIGSNQVLNFTKIAIVKLKNPEYKFIKQGMKTYLGEVHDNEVTGWGILYYNGNGQIIYKGEFKNGKRHGKGVYYDGKGNIKYKGTFEKGKFKN